MFSSSNSSSFSSTAIAGTSGNDIKGVVPLCIFLENFKRLGAKSLLDFFYIMDEANVSVLSVNEPIINTENTLVRDIVLAVLGAVSKDESERISRRVKSGMRKARAEGKRIGARAKNIDLDELMEIYNDYSEWGWRRIAEEYNRNRRGRNRISWATARGRILDRMHDEKDL